MNYPAATMLTETEIFANLEVQGFGYEPPGGGGDEPEYGASFQDGIKVFLVGSDDERLEITAFLDEGVIEQLEYELLGQVAEEIVR